MYNTIYPNYVNNYFGANNRRITRKQEEEKSPSQTLQKAENEPQQDKHAPKDGGMYFPNGEKTAIDYTRRQINIDQVIKDFRNTANAIGVPEELKSEVNGYLSLVESQSRKDAPNPQIIQSNIKTASKLLDEYITNTLKKPSRVVENWVDTLFLQEVDYKSAIKPTEEPAEEITDPTHDVIEEETVEPEVIPNDQPKKGFYVPSDADLKQLLTEAKSFANNNNKEHALYLFQQAMDYAEQIGDYQACAIIHYEQGKIYDSFNRLEDALYNYDRAAKQSNDNNIKARAHISMGKIYDDFIYFKPAVDHYCAAVSFAGESDNLKLQTKALTDLAQIHTDRYEKDNAVMFISFASAIAEETKDNKVKGYTYSKGARNYTKLNDKARALKYYGNSAQAYSLVEDNENLAKNYRDAAQIMLGYGNKAKARTLLSKAYTAAQKTDNTVLRQEITQKIAAL